MRYHALACDYDGTLATDGKVDAATVAALKQVRESGRKLIMVTGRELPQLLETFPELDMFDSVVAENGALLYCPETREEKPLADPPPHTFAQALKARGVESVSQGRVICATWEPHEVVALEVIRDLGLELQVIFNKGAVMVLPTGVNKATGLGHALASLGLSPHNTVGIGDAENDHAFLSICECGVAVANALAVTKKYVDFVTQGDHGAGVVELAHMLIDNDLGEITGKLSRHHIVLGAGEDGGEVKLPASGANIMIAGTSGGGKSTLASGILERLAEKKYQYCIIDPEGDYSELSDVVVLGDDRRPPNPAEVIDLLSEPEQNAVINLIGVSIEHRPDFFLDLLRRIQQLRDKTGRPHWLLIDEAHHLFPVARGQSADLPTKGAILITVHPDSVASRVLENVDTLLAIGESPQTSIVDFAKALGKPPPAVPDRKLEAGDAMVWNDRDDEKAFWVRSVPPKIERKRHNRKYVEGDLGPELSFYFTGPEQKLNLRAQNLHIFLQLAEGLDDQTWSYHLERGDYAKWFREVIKDDGLASEVENNALSLSAQESRAYIRQKVEERYTAAV